MLLDFDGVRPDSDNFFTDHGGEGEVRQNRHIHYLQVHRPCLVDVAPAPFKYLGLYRARSVGRVKFYVSVM